MDQIRKKVIKTDDKLFWIFGGIVVVGLVILIIFTWKRKEGYITTKDALMGEYSILLQNYSQYPSEIQDRTNRKWGRYIPMSINVVSNMSFEQIGNELNTLRFRLGRLRDELRIFQQETRELTTEQIEILWEQILNLCDRARRFGQFPCEINNWNITRDRYRSNDRNAVELARRDLVRLSNLVRDLERQEAEEGNWELLERQ